VIVGTKVRLLADDLTGDIEAGVIKSVEESLIRLQRDYVDLIQLHNFVSSERNLERRWVTPDDVEAAISACRTLKAQGKISY
jgi:aryl-alcohol dehydrogenase-like predicted oxidoreductase